MNGYIYKVTNILTNKVYIGQTSYTLERRWQQHIYDAFRIKSNYSHFQRAIRKYGESTFIIEKIEECPVEMLNDREQYWIAYYNSFYEGYNSTLGGEGCRTLELNEEEIINLYDKNNSIIQIAEKYNVSCYTIRNILIHNKCKIRNLKESSRINGTAVYCEFEDNIMYFSSLKEAGEFVLNKRLSNANTYKVAASIIRNAILTGKKIYGGYWFSDDYTSEYIQEQRTKIKQNNKKNPLSHKDNCPICGSLKDKKSTVCNVCYHQSKLNNKHKPTKQELEKLLQKLSEEEIANFYGITIASVIRWERKFDIKRKYRNKKMLPDKNEFMLMINKYTNSELANIYNVSKNLIIQWKHEFNLNINSDNSVKVYCKELNTVFNSIREAAHEVYPECSVNSAYNSIVLRCKNGKAYKGYHWSYI